MESHTYDPEMKLDFEKQLVTGRKVEEVQVNYEIKNFVKAHGKIHEIFY